MTLHVVARIDAKPEQLSVVENARRAMPAPTRAEAGCLPYELHRDLDHPIGLVMLERWRDEAALPSQTATPHMARLRAVLADRIRDIGISRLFQIG